MFKLVFTNNFKKDIRRLQKRGYNFEVIKQAIIILEEKGYLPIYLINYQEIILVSGRLI